MFLVSNSHKYLGPGLFAEFSRHRDHLKIYTGRKQRYFCNYLFNRVYFYSFTWSIVHVKDFTLKYGVHPIPKAVHQGAEDSQDKGIESEMSLLILLLC